MEDNKKDVKETTVDTKPEAQHSSKGNEMGDVTKDVNSSVPTLMQNETTLTTTAATPPVKEVKVEEKVPMSEGDKKTEVVEEKKAENIQVEKSDTAEVETKVTADTSSPEEREQKSGSTKTVVAFIAGVVVAFGVNAILGMGSAEVVSGNFKDDQVVAKVNGEKIFGKALNLQVDQFALIRGVADLSVEEEALQNEITTQALDALINTELIAQAARLEGIEVTEEEIREEYDRLIESIGGQEAADERFAHFGSNAEEFRAGLHNELMVSKYIERMISISSITVTEDEIEQFYTSAVAAMPQDAPTLEEVRGVITEQLQAKKQQDALAALLQQLREGALIEKMI